jgi:hypothetical protein
MFSALPPTADIAQHGRYVHSVPQSGPSLKYKRRLRPRQYPESELSDTAAFEPALTDLFLGPDERLSFDVISVDVGIDMLL